MDEVCCAVYWVYYECWGCGEGEAGGVGFFAYEFIGGEFLAEEG